MARASLSYTLGRLDQAEADAVARADLVATQAFRTAITWADRVGAEGFGARARAGLASVLPAGDPERVALGSEARAIAARLDMAAVVAEAETVLGAGDPREATVLADLPVPAPISVTARVRTLGRFEVIGAGATEPAPRNRRTGRRARPVMPSRS